MPQKPLYLVKERGIYELFYAKGFMFYGRRIKTILHFQVKFFGCCFIAFRVPKIYYKSLVGAPIDFNITKKYTKNEEDMAFETRKGLEFFFKSLEAKYHNPLPSLLAFSSMFLYFWCFENICSLPVHASNNINIVQFG
jgi:hypothetical protein